MSRATRWSCRSCGTTLGHVCDATLYPLVAVASLDRRGAARVPCLPCGRARIWVPSTTRAAREGIDCATIPRS